MSGPGRAVAPGGRAQPPLPGAGERAQPHGPIPRQTELGLRNSSRWSWQDKKPNEKIYVWGRYHKSQEKWVLPKQPWKERGLYPAEPMVPVASAGPPHAAV